MKLRIPVFVKITAPLLLIITLSVSISGYRVYQASTQRWQSEMDRRLERVAGLVATTVDPQTLDVIREPVDIDGEAYTTVAASLEQAAIASNIEWIGIYYQRDGYFYYWVDNDYTGVGYPFFYPTVEHLAAFQDRQTHRVRYIDEFGSYYGFVAPIIAGDEVIGIVEASLSAEASQLLERRTLSQVLPILIGGVLIALSASLLLTMMAFQQPLRRLQHGAQALVEGQFGHTIPFDANDEMGDLAAAFNRMSVEIKRLYGQLQAYNRELETRVEERTVELREERNRLTTILQNIADGLVVTDEKGYIEVVNPAFANLVAHPVEALIAQPLQEALPVQELSAMAMDSLNAPDQVFTANIAWKPPTAPQARVYKVVLCALLERETANVLGSVAILHDVTHEVEVDQMKTDFISTVSHELRTPLTSVLGFAKLILKTFERNITPFVPVNDKRAHQASTRIRDNLEIIVSEAERLTRLINDVLDVAKIEAGKVEWHMANVDITDLIPNAIAATRALAQEKNLRIDSSIASNLPLLYADPDRIVQVVTNLLSNAVKFTDTGGIRVNVHTFTLHPNGATTPDLPFAARLEGLEPGAWITVSVQDSGTGIAEENFDKVFEKFKQVGSLMTDRPKGTGLGLTICKEIVEHHNGRIWVESILGEGSTFTFVLPSKSATPSLAPLIEEIRGRMEEVVYPASKEARILIVDDETHIRELLYQELTEVGYQVLQAADGVVGLAMARAERPDLIIMDLMMPGISGFDAISALRSDEATAHIPVLILSVLEDREKGYRLGADAYLTKPINATEVLATVVRLLARAARGEGYKKVLVIEENASVVDTLTKVFLEKGYEVVSATDVVEGVSRAMTEQPRFIVLDALMTQMNNYEILRTLKCTRETQSARIVVVAMRTSAIQTSGGQEFAPATGNVDIGTEVLQHGADYYGKSDEIEKLIEILSGEMGVERNTGNNTANTTRET